MASIQDFSTRVAPPIIPKLPTQDVLKRCVNGLTKQIKATSDPEKKYRLRAIKTEFQYLLDNL